MTHKPLLPLALTLLFCPVGSVSASSTKSTHQNLQYCKPDRFFLHLSDGEMRNAVQ